MHWEFQKIEKEDILGKMAANKKTTNISQVPQRRGSMEGSIKVIDPSLHILEEIRKLRQEMKDQRHEMKDDLKESMQEIREEIKEARIEMRKDYKKEMDSHSKRIEKIASELKNTHKEIQDVKDKTRNLEQISKELRYKQETQYNMEMNNELRYRDRCIKIKDLLKKSNEDLTERVLPDLAKYLGLTEESMELEIDKIFRVNSTQAREKKIPRDVVVCLVRSKIRDLIIQKNYDRKLFIENKEIRIFKDIPSQILVARSKYKSLTQLLKQLNINYKWERIEGLTFFCNQKRFRIDNEEKAKEAERRLKKEYRDKGEEGRENYHYKREWRNRNIKRKGNEEEGTDLHKDKQDNEERRTNEEEEEYRNLEENPEEGDNIIQKGREIDDLLDLLDTEETNTDKQ